MDQMRLFLLNFVKKKRLDPLLPETWYNLNYSEIAKDKRGKVILQKFKGYENAVQSLFPEIQFEASSFEKNMWQDVRNRRQFFENYSRRRGFDALLPENWYQEARSNILKAKDAEKVLVYYGGSVKRALVDLFPEIGLERSRFPTSRWSSEKSRRGVFIKYARQHRFDPLNAENWYSQSKKKITATLGAYRVLMYHRNSISRALIDLFPEIGLDKSKFWNANWRDPTTRRRFLEKYAKEHGFNPAVPENWYMQKRKDILAKKGALRLIRLYNGNISKVLLDTFPDIGLDASKMWLLCILYILYFFDACKKIKEPRALVLTTFGAIFMFYAKTWTFSGCKFHRVACWSFGVAMQGKLYPMKQVQLQTLLNPEGSRFSAKNS
eukprot:Phypoly_transcript_11369.p1 GENE.Phypoly_transcript_11369~~Phypoly_transcript_11369.p1  ORF type:complete len:392 (+),score=44.19 Phypoly_transcript_11369:39-1178(+)